MHRTNILKIISVNSLSPIFSHNTRFCNPIKTSFVKWKNPNYLIEIIPPKRRKAHNNKFRFFFIIISNNLKKVVYSLVV